jgi:hypothetical protein
MAKIARRADRETCAALSVAQFSSGGSQAHEFCERWCVRSTRAVARKRWNKAAHNRVAMTGERPQVNTAGQPAVGTANPQKPIPRSNGSTDHWGKQHWHSLGLTFVPGHDQELDLSKYLRVPASGVFRCSLRTRIHLAAVDCRNLAHGDDPPSPDICGARQEKKPPVRIGGQVTAWLFMPPLKSPQWGPAPSNRLGASWQIYAKSM